MERIKVTEGQRIGVPLTARDQQRLRALEQRLELSGDAIMRLALRELAGQVLNDALGLRPLAARLAALEAKQEGGAL